MTFSISLFITLLFTITALTESVTYTSVIQTNSGPIRGEILTTVRKSLQYASFRGIPYAEPPVGHLRFKSPVEKRKWSEVFNATEEGNICIQPIIETGEIRGSEDCLVLSIFTPHTDFSALKNEKLKPVIAWIHGGGFMVGFAQANTTGPDFILEEDVIVVMFQYRLGAFGFLNLNHENATGNAGLKDQVLALKWINKNIAKFGGNPNKVTILGQSAGAASVDLHVLSEMSKGLFSQSISMSGSPLCLYWGIQSNEEAHSNAFSLGSKLEIKTNTTNELLNALYAIPATEITAKSIRIPLIPFRVTIERYTGTNKQEKFLSECAINKYISGNYNKNPHIVGFTSNEAKSFFGDSSNLLLYCLATMELLKEASIPLDIPIMRKYISYVGGKSNFTQQDFEKLMQTSSNLFFATGIDSKQKLLNIHNNHSIYYYRFSFESGITKKRQYNDFSNSNLIGVGHGEDLPYIFYMPHYDVPINRTDVKLMTNRYVRLITNFAKYGNPTPNGRQDKLLNITWPNAGRHGLHLNIDINLSIGFRPINDEADVMELASIGNSALLNDCINLQDCRIKDTHS